MQAELADEFLLFSRKKLLEQYWPRMRKAVEPLTDEQVWWRPNEASNSIGNLLLHLNGNVRQWMVASFNRLEDARDRPATVPVLALKAYWNSPNRPEFATPAEPLTRRRSPPVVPAGGAPVSQMVLFAASTD